MPEGNYLSTMSQVTWGEEYAVEQALTATVIPTYGSPARVISSFSGLTAHKYRGQTATVVPISGGEANGQVLHIIDNTETTITFEELVELTGASPTGIVLATTDTLVITQFGVLQGDLANYFGHLEESELPTGKFSSYKVFPHGSTLKPGRHQYIQTGVVYEKDLPLKLVTGRLLKFALGQCIDDARNVQGYSLGSSILAQATVIGQKTIHSTAHGYTAGYIQIGDPAGSDDSPEVRLIDSYTVDTITFTTPLGNEHCAGEELTNFASIGTGYMIHTLKPSIRLPSWNLKRTLFRHKGGCISGLDDCKVWLGLKVKSLALAHAPGDELFQATISIVAVDEDDTTETDRESAMVVTEYLVGGTGTVYKTPYYYKGAVIDLNNVIYHQAGEFSGSVDREISTRTYANSYKGIKPTEHNEGVLNCDFKIKIPYHNKELYNMMKAGTGFVSKYKMYRDGDSVDVGLHDNIEFQFYDCYIEDAPDSLPKDQGEIDIEHSASPGYMWAVVEDDIPFY